MSHSSTRSRPRRRKIDDDPRTCDVRLESLPPDRIMLACEIRKHVPGKPSPQSFARWARAGCRGADGEIHVLPSVRIGRKLGFRPGDLIRFFEQLGRNTPNES